MRPGSQSQVSWWGVAVTALSAGGGQPEDGVHAGLVGDEVDVLGVGVLADDGGEAEPGSAEAERDFLQGELRAGDGGGHGVVVLSWGWGARSVLDGAGGDAGGDVALCDDEEDGGGDGGDDGGGHDRVPLLVVVADVVVDAEGDGLVVAAAVEGAGEDEVRPGPQEGEQRHGDDRVAADGQDDRPEGARRSRRRRRGRRAGVPAGCRT